MVPTAPPPKRTRGAVADNRSALTRAAKRCLATRGYSLTTAREIAAEASTSLGAISYHFGTTSRLLNEALFEILADGVAAFANSGMSASHALAEAVRAATRQPVLTGAAFEAVAEATRDDDRRQQLAGHYRSLREAVVTATDRPLTEAEAAVFVALVDGLSLQAVLDPTLELDTTEVARACATVLSDRSA
jgi:AcrR family transcriptional regulator